MTQTLRITIIGLGHIGTSIGLALKHTDLDLYIVGHDKEPNHTRVATRRKAIDKGEWNLPASVEGADLVILALPLDAIEETLQYIAQDLRPNAVVMDTASLKVPVLEWARKHLPENVHFVGGHPIVRDVRSGPENARADLFQNQIFTLCTTHDTHAKAVALATNLATALGARPLFLDPEEHDGMMAAVEHMPELLALALGQAVMGQGAWRETRKLAGSQFEASTYTVTRTPSALAADLLLNRDRVIAWLDVLDRTLAYWRNLLQTEDEETIQRMAASVLEARTDWIIAAETGQWEEKPKVETFSVRDWLFGQSLTRRRTKK